MTRRREVESHLHTLAEIRGILAAMKNLSFMETRKLARFIGAQNQAVRTVEQAAADLLQWHPGLLPGPAGEAVLLVLVGAERGFCGDYNGQLLARLEDHCRQTACRPRLLVVGTRLAERLEGDGRVLQVLTGAQVAEEVPAVLQRIVTAIDGLEARIGPVQVNALYHQGHGVQVTALLPPFQGLPPPPAGLRGPPHLYLEPQALLARLTDHYLFAVLHALCYSALTAEHQQRIQHLDGALRRLDEECGRLHIRRNALRQEEITEEIEQILLSAQAMADEPGGL